MKTADPIAVKRKRLVEIIHATRQARVKFLAENPGEDYNLRAAIEGAERPVIERDCARLSPESVENLVAYYEAGGLPKYVW